MLNSRGDWVFLVKDNAVAKLDRLSGSQAESGFCSMPSRRSSCQSYSTSSQQLSSTRSSQLSYTSQEFHHTERVSSTFEFFLHSSVFFDIEIQFLASL